MNTPFPYTISPLGDSALTIDFGNVIDREINSYVRRLFHHFKQKEYPGVTDIVPAYSSLGFYYSVPAVRQWAKGKTAFEALVQVIETELHEAVEPGTQPQRKINIPVCYASAYAPDIEFVAAQQKIPVAKVIALHTSRLYTVYMLGFLPGFPYMGEVDDAIAVPRKQQPRAQVPPGAVGLAGKQTGIYPLASPGGWQLIGRTPLLLFDRARNDPALLQPGDLVQFHSISEDEFKHY